MAENTPAFAPGNCSFRMHKSKASTMRIVMFDHHGIINAYTLETSLAGVNGRHFSCHDLQYIGENFCRTLVAFHGHQPSLRMLTPIQTFSAESG